MFYVNSVYNLNLKPLIAVFNRYYEDFLVEDFYKIFQNINVIIYYNLIFIYED